MINILKNVLVLNLDTLKPCLSWSVLCLPHQMLCLPQQMLCCAYLIRCYAYLSRRYAYLSRCHFEEGEQQLPAEQISRRKHMLLYVRLKQHVLADLKVSQGHLHGRHACLQHWHQRSRRASVHVIREKWFDGKIEKSWKFCIKCPN